MGKEEKIKRDNQLSTHTEREMRRENKSWQAAEKKQV